MRVGCTKISLVAQPEGHGKYKWTDGSTYEGKWKVLSQHQHESNFFLGQWIECISTLSTVV